MIEEDHRAYFHLDGTAIQSMHGIAHGGRQFRVAEGAGELPLHRLEMWRAHDEVDGVSHQLIAARRPGEPGERRIDRRDALTIVHEYAIR
jgi:hypothetical protein